MCCISRSAVSRRIRRSSGVSVPLAARRGASSSSDVGRKNDVPPATETVADTVQRNAVPIQVVDDGVLQKLLFGKERVILFVSQKVVVHPLLLTLSHGPCR